MSCRLVSHSPCLYALCGYSLLGVAPPVAVIGNVILLAELNAGQPEALGLGDGLLDSPLLMGYAVDGDDHTGAVGAALAMDEDGPILTRVNDGQCALHLLIRRTSQTRHGNVEIAHAGGFSLGLLLSRIITGAAKV